MRSYILVYIYIHIYHLFKNIQIEAYIFMYISPALSISLYLSNVRGSLEPGTQYPEPEVQNPEPGTPNPKPKAPSPKLHAQSSKPHAADQKPKPGGQAGWATESLCICICQCKCMCICMCICVCICDRTSQARWARSLGGLPRFLHATANPKPGGTLYRDSCVTANAHPNPKPDCKPEARWARRQGGRPRVLRAPLSAGNKTLNPHY